MLPFQFQHLIGTQFASIVRRSDYENKLRGKMPSRIDQRINRRVLARFEVPRRPAEDAPRIALEYAQQVNTLVTSIGLSPPLRAIESKPDTSIFVLDAIRRKVQPHNTYYGLPSDGTIIQLENEAVRHGVTLVRSDAIQFNRLVILKPKVYSKDWLGLSGLWARPIIHLSPAGKGQYFVDRGVLDINHNYVQLAEPFLIDSVAVNHFAEAEEFIQKVFADGFGEVFTTQPACRLFD